MSDSPKPVRRPRKKTETAPAETTPASTPVSGESSTGDSGGGLTLVSSFSGDTSTPDSGSSAGERPRREGSGGRGGGERRREERRGEEGSAEPAAETKPRKRQKPPTMAGRALEKERKLAAEILRFWYATRPGTAPKKGRDERRVDYRFTVDQIAELIHVRRDDQDDLSRGNTLAADLRAHFDSVTGKGKWLKNTATEKVARNQSEMLNYMREKIARDLGFDAVAKVTASDISGALVAGGVALADLSSTRSEATTPQGSRTNWEVIVAGLIIALFVSAAIIFG